MKPPSYRLKARGRVSLKAYYSSIVEHVQVVYVYCSRRTLTHKGRYKPIVGSTNSKSNKLKRPMNKSLHAEKSVNYLKA